MSHTKRLDWLRQHGFNYVIRSCDIPELGMCVWVDGVKGLRAVSMWLAVRDGSAVIHGVNEPALTWWQLQDWVTGKTDVKKQIAKPRSLFEMDE